MKKAYVILARALAYIDVDELAPKGNVLLVAVVQALVEKYKFQKYPSKPEELDRNKGVEFGEGIADGIPIQRLAIFESLLLVETRSDTTDAQVLLSDILSWAVETFGMTLTEEMIRRWGYVSSVVFYGDPKLLDVHRAISNLSSKVTEAVSERWNEEILYQPIRLAVGHDPNSRKWPVAQFTIERKGQASFSENKYFSEAPLQTHEHWKMLEEFEREVLNG